MKNLGTNSLKLLLVGTLPPPHHGQSIAFKAAYDSCFCIKKNVSTSFRGKLGLIKAFWYFIEIPIQLLIFRPNKVYFLCSRSPIGGFRDVYLILLCKLFSIPLFNHLHGSDFKLYVNSLPSIYRKLVVYCFNHVSKHAVLVSGMESVFDVLDNPKVFTIPNFFHEEVRPSKFQKSRSETLKILYLSSIITSKGIFFLIDSIKSLTKNGIKVELKVAGGFISDPNVSDKDCSNEFYKAMKYQENITYLGVLNSEEKCKVLIWADILALPSFYPSEAVPLAIIEAMAAGCAIITTKYRYLPNIVIDTENGFLVKAMNSEKITEKLTYLAFNRDDLLNIQLHNFNIAPKLYSIDKYQKNIREFLGVE